MAEVKSLIVNGMEFPIKYGGLTQSRNKIWSSNTGRNNAGNMVGTILAIKNKFEVALTPITPEQADLLDSVISDIDNPFQTAQILYLDGSIKEIQIYFGDVSYPWLGRKIGSNGLINGVKVSLIEQ